MYTGETHLNYLLDKKEIRAKFVRIFLRIVGWVERDSVKIADLGGVFGCPLCLNVPKFE